MTSASESGSITKMALRIVDLVSVQGYDWLSCTVGIVTEIKNLVHDQTGVEYSAVTAVINNKKYTFTEQDFKLISRTEKTDT